MGLLLLGVVFPTGYCSASGGPTASLAQAACFAPAQAAAHAGERVCVEGTITQATYAQRTNGQPTFLDFGTQFTAVIWGEDRAKFNPPPETLRGRQMRVGGTVEIFRSKAQIIVRDPQQLSPPGGPPPQLTATRTAASPTSNPVAAVSPTPNPPAAATAEAATSTPAAVTASATPAPTRTSAPATAIDTALLASPAPATVDSLHEGADDPGGGASPAMIAAGLVLVALGGAGGAWYRLRRR